jgi:hypothetical protein
MNFEDFRAKLQAAIYAGGLGPEFSLQDLFGGRWPELPAGVRVKLGEWFKQNVRGSDSFDGENPFDGIEFSQKKSNNLSVYRLVAN